MTAPTALLVTEAPEIIARIAPGAWQHRRSQELTECDGAWLVGREKSGEAKHGAKEIAPTRGIRWPTLSETETCSLHAQPAQQPLTQLIPRSLCTQWRMPQRASARQGADASRPIIK